MNIKVITAVEKYEKQPGEITCFLAGGITDCGEWQDEVINYLKNVDVDLTGLVLFNPRRKNFPIHDPNASNEQITWEFNMLEQMDIFSMYFANSPKSVQPICMYELGRNLAKMEVRFPNDYMNRITVSVEQGYSREQDVVIQSKLAMKGQNFVETNSNPEKHADTIIRAFNWLKTLRIKPIVKSENQTLLSVDLNLDKKFLKFYTAHYVTNNQPRDYFFVSRNSMKDLAINHDLVKPTAIEAFTYYVDPETMEIKVVMIEEFRSALGRYVTSFCAGLIENGEDVNKAIEREVYEEVGGKVEKITLLQDYPLSMCAGMCDEANYMAVVKLSSIGKQHLEETEDIKIKVYSLDELNSLIKNNQIYLTASGLLGYLSILSIVG